jgi:hypothetical protein
LQGSFIFTAATTSQQPLNADMLIEVGPLDGIPLAEQPPMRAFVGRCMHKPWIPAERDTQSTPIQQIDSQPRVSHLDGDGNRFSLKHQSIHSIRSELKTRTCMDHPARWQAY